MFSDNFVLKLGLFVVIAVIHTKADVSSCSETCEVLVNIDSGPVCGRVLLAEDGSRYYSFRGVPYAKPPLGHRRFQIPEPPEPWDEPLHAFVEGPSCPQRNIFYGHIPVQINGQSEDCLYVNVHVPGSSNTNGNKLEENVTNSSNIGLPMLVFIHGGGLSCGSGDSDLHGPEYLMPKNVILVSFNYRLNVFGFLCLNTAKTPCNRGLWDMLAVLKWVNRNARAFGGNPDNITLMGHSAGAAGAHLLSITEHAKGLFKNLILMSGTSFPSFYTASRSNAKRMADIFLQRLDLNEADPDTAYQKLAELPINKIMAANDYTQLQAGIMAFMPVIDIEQNGTPKFLDDEPISLFGAGRGKNIPTLISFTNNEMAFSTFYFMVSNTVDRIKAKPEAILTPRLASNLSPDQIKKTVEKIHKKYFNGEPNMERLVTYLNDSYFSYPTFKLAEWRTALNGAPLYINQFSYESSFSPIKYGLWIDHNGACHEEDLTYVFRTNAVLNKYLHIPPREKDDMMMEWMTTIITNFMRCSNPTCMADEVSPWPPVQEDNITYQDIGDPMVYKTKTLSREQREMIEFFDSIDSESSIVTAVRLMVSVVQSKPLYKCREVTTNAFSVVAPVMLAYIYSDKKCQEN